mgnify:FL=1
MKIDIGILGMGYVGLPLAIAMAEKHKVIGFDVDKNRISSLKMGIDKKKDVTSKQIKKTDLTYSNKPESLKNCNIYIVTVPTPIKHNKLPDFTFLKNASKIISKFLKIGDVVIYESTVYPGATEEICIPILEISSLKINKDFYVGYSPERINVGDQVNTLKTIPKIVSASNKYSLKIIKKLYESIIDAEVRPVSSIKIAEAAKVIENVQRDVNIAFVNELAMMFKSFEIDTHEVLNAACTKWNFLNFRPGLVGGHCIGIDPYYLAHKSISMGYKPEILFSARKINEEVPNFVLKDLIQKLSFHKIKTSKAKVLFLGITFKENTSDIRNSKALSLALGLKKTCKNILVYDPYLKGEDLNLEFEFTSNLPEEQKFDVLVLAVAHSLFLKINPLTLLSKVGFVYDIKAVFDSHEKIYRL